MKRPAPSCPASRPSARRAQLLAAALALAALWPARAILAIPQLPHAPSAGIQCLDCHAPYAGMNDPVLSKGAAGAGSGLVTLNDPGQAWAPGTWVGAVVTILTGANTGEFRTVTASTATELTWGLALPSPLAVGDTYQIGRTTQFDIETKCKSCHNPTGMAAAMADVGLHVPGGVVVGCGKCHDPHNVDPNSGVGKGLIRNKVRWPTASGLVAVPASAGNAMVAGAPSYNGICETCHTQTAYHRNNGSGDHAHNTSSGCMDCHPHGKGFEPMGCTQCHDKPQGPRRVIVPSAGGPVADFGRASHHVKGSVQDGDCVVCHATDQHGKGTVRLRDPDNAGVVWPASDPAAAGLFCLHCHDADGASAGAGQMPFSDAVSVPNIDRSGAFAASAHAGSGLTCTNCHGNGHGSNLKKLQVPFDGAPGADNALEEEGFCFACHKAGGVINEPVSNGWFGATYTSFSNNIQADFGLASTHAVVDSESGHVFDPGTGSQELECTSCHDPHQDTGRYWAAMANKSPVTLGSVWGDQPAEKAAAFDAGHVYLAPGLGLAGPTLTGAPMPIDGAGNSQLTASVRPDYNTFCLSCHAVPVAGVTAIDWTTKKHGSAPAEPQGTLGLTVKAPYVTANRGQYVLDCLDCHEVHGSANTGLLRRSANGSPVTTTITSTATTQWKGLCTKCHADAISHHNADIQTKAGSTGCSFCHPHGSYKSCASSGCHSHSSFF